VTREVYERAEVLETATRLEPRTTRRPGVAVAAAALLAALALYGYCLVRTAWLSDDAYITFRTVENFVAGHGLTWNPDERVQAYTHPLWMFLLSGLRLFSGEIYYTSLFVSMVLSVGAVLILVFGIARSAGQALLAVTICAFSRAFVDYSTSGLENPLSYLLVGLFLMAFLRDGRASGAGYRVSGVGCRASGNEKQQRQQQQQQRPG
jgi:hypothetical protein